MKFLENLCERVDILAGLALLTLCLALCLIVVWTLI